jgi:predicted nucleic acid-binding Zn ribbon protein
MPVYNYKCNVCGHEYQEGRLASEEQFKIACTVVGCTGTNVEVK